MMKKELWLFGLMILPAVFTYGTSRAQNSGDFYDSLLISDELKTEENAEEAKDSAGRLLDAKPREIKIDSPLLRSHQEKLKKAKRAQLAKKKNKTLAENEPGPFGLAWGATYDEVKKEGVSLSDRKTTSITSAPRIFPKASKPSVKSFSLSASKTNSGG